MSFKIIEDIDKPVYLIVPEAFESDGTVWEPPESWSPEKRESLFKNKFQQPDKEVWQSRKCYLKSKSIDTYRHAEEQMKLLKLLPSQPGREIPNEVFVKIEESTDEENENVLGERPTWPRVYTRQNPVPIPPQIQINNNDTDTPTPTQQEEAPIPEIENDIPSDLKNVLDASFGCNSDSKSECQSSKILLKILESQLQYQKDNAKQITELREFINNGFNNINSEVDMLKQMHYSNALSTVNPDNYPKRFCIENFNKISTCEEANRLEKMLMIPEFKADMIEKMSQLLGLQGSRTGEGLDCCYYLIQKLFQRKYIQICSWNGSTSTEMDDAKIAFSKYKNIISFFTSVISQADTEFTSEKTKEFFKACLGTSAGPFLGPSSSGPSSGSSTGPSNTNENPELNNNESQNRFRTQLKRKGQGQGQAHPLVRIKIERIPSIQESWEAGKLEEFENILRAAITRLAQNYKRMRKN